MTQPDQTAPAPTFQGLPHLDPSRRHDVLYIVKSVESNPNGDPDNQGRPRTNPFTGHGLITDVSVKRKIRDHITLLRPEMTPERQTRCNILIADGSVLELTMARIYREQKIQVQDGVSFSDEEITALLDSGLTLPDAFEIEDGNVSYDGSLKARAVKAFTAELAEQDTLGSDLKDKLTRLVQTPVVAPTDRKANAARATPALREQFIDARLFGYTIPSSSYSAQPTRGPIQMDNPVSLAPVGINEYAIVRTARSKDSEKEGAQFGRRGTVDATYVGHAYYSPQYAYQDGQLYVTPEDLELFYDGLLNGYETTRSSARPSIQVHAVVVFTHQRLLGNARSHTLFGLVKVQDDGRGGFTLDLPSPDQLPAGITMRTLGEN